MATSGPDPVTGPTEPVDRWLARRGVDLAFALVTLVSLVSWYRATDPGWFWIDEWPIARQVTSWTGIFEPYNQHLSITILGIYHVLLSLFGFTTHLPFRVTALLSFAAVAVAFYRTTRRPLGPLAAAIGGVVLLWPARISIETASINHWLTLTGAVLCAHGLRSEGRRGDGFVSGGLVLALISSGGGVAAVVAAVVHSACRRARPARWLAVLVPAAAWLAWYIAAAPPTHPFVAAAQSGPYDAMVRAATLFARSFRSLALAHEVAGWVVLALFVAVVYRRLSQGLAASAEALAWTAGLGAWWFGLVWNRAYFADEHVFRYQQVSACFILLAVTPRHAVDWTPLTRRIGSTGAARWLGPRRRLLVGPAAVVVAALTLAAAVSDDLAYSGSFQRSAGRNAQLESGAAALPGVVPPDTLLSPAMGFVPAGAIPELFERFRPPEWAGDVDHVVALAASLSVRDDVHGPLWPGCQALDQPHLISPGRMIVVRAGEFPSQVQVRRFDSNWIPVGTVPADHSAWLVLPELHSPLGWEVRAADGCTDSLQ